MKSNNASVLTQVKSLRQSPAASVLGFIFGGFVPAATFTVAHYQVAAHPHLWLLVGGGLIFSALTVYQWGNKAFRNRGKAFGFVVLIEGCLTFGGQWLPFGALALLIGINGIATAHALVAGSASQTTRKERTSKNTSNAVKATRRLRAVA